MANRLQEVTDTLFLHQGKLKTWDDSSCRFSPTSFAGEFVIRYPQFYLNIPDYGGFGSNSKYHGNIDSVSYHSPRASYSYEATKSVKKFPLPIPAITFAQHHPFESPSNVAVENMEEWSMMVAPIPCYDDIRGYLDCFAFVLSPKSNPLKFWIAHYFMCRIALKKRNGKLRLFGVEAPERPPEPTSIASVPAPF